MPNFALIRRERSVLDRQDRYDSEPGNAKANDLTDFATVGFTF